MRPYAIVALIVILMGSLILSPFRLIAANSTASTDGLLASTEQMIEQLMQQIDRQRALNVNPETITVEHIEAWKKDAAKGLSYAQFNLGVAYIKGIHVRHSYPEAMRLFRLAALQGEASAQFNIGVMYHNGQGVRQNKKIAKEWFGKACDNGLQEGCDEYRKLNEAGY
jgi:TPR repeat protein